MGRVTVRLPDKLHRCLREEAARRGASLNDVIVQAVGDALSEVQEPEGPPKTPLQKEVERIRRLLGPMVGGIDFNNYPEHLRPPDDLPDTDTLRESIPRYVPPLSQAIIEEREESPY